MSVLLMLWRPNQVLIRKSVKLWYEARFEQTRVFRLLRGKIRAVSVPSGGWRLLHPGACIMFGSHSYAGAQPCTSNEFAGFSLHILNGPEYSSLSLLPSISRVLSVSPWRLLVVLKVNYCEINFIDRVCGHVHGIGLQSFLCSQCR